MHKQQERIYTAVFFKYRQLKYCTTRKRQWQRRDHQTDVVHHNEIRFRSATIVTYRSHGVKLRNVFVGKAKHSVTPTRIQHDAISGYQYWASFIGVSWLRIQRLSQTRQYFSRYYSIRFVFAV